MKKNEQGLTLIELMVAGVILGLVVGVIFKVLATGSSLFATQAKVAESQMSARFGMAIVAQDLATAGAGATGHCIDDAHIPDKGDSCAFDLDPFHLQAVWFLDASFTDAVNNQYKPDEIYILTNPYPGDRAYVDSQSGGILNVMENAVTDEPLYNEVLVQSGLVVIDQRGSRSIRPGGAAATNPALVTTGTGVSSLWTFQVSPVLPTGDTETHGGADTIISPIAWIRYYLDKDPDDPTGKRIDLVRSVYNYPGQAATSTDIVANDVVDFQLTFCMDTNYDANSALAETPNIVCGISDQTKVNTSPEQIRSITVTLRTREKGEDTSAYADPDLPFSYYDLDGNLNNGVCRVRSITRTVTAYNLGIR